MSDLYVIGNIHSDNSGKVQEIFDVLEAAGYTLAYNSKTKNSAVIMKEIEDEEPAEE